MIIKDIKEIRLNDISKDDFRIRIELLEGAVLVIGQDGECALKDNIRIIDCFTLEIIE